MKTSLLTLFIAIFDSKEKTLLYLNAGHQPAILANGGEYSLLKKGCTVLGMFEELPKIEVGHIELKEESKLLCFTDGLSELEDRQGNHLEAEGLLELMRENKKPEDLKTAIEKKIESFKKRSGITDDVTFLVAEFLR